MAWEKERIDQSVYSQGDVDKWVYSTCNICSVGCGCYTAVKDGKIVGIKGNGEHPINRGRLGPKGENQWHANNAPDRLKTPLIKNAEGRGLRKMKYNEIQLTDFILKDRIWTKFVTYMFIHAI